MQETAMIQIEDKGIKLSEIPDESFKFDDEFPTKMSLPGLDGELANELREKCWGRFMGQYMEPFHGHWVDLHC